MSGEGSGFRVHRGVAEIRGETFLPHRLLPQRHRDAEEDKNEFCSLLERMRYRNRWRVEKGLDAAEKSVYATVSGATGYWVLNA